MFVPSGRKLLRTRELLLRFAPLHMVGLSHPRDTSGSRGGIRRPQRHERDVHITAQ